MEGKTHTPQNATFFEFVSRSFNVEESALVFMYRTHFTDAESLEFKETILLHNAEGIQALPADFLHAMMEDLHLILGVSYYKLFCPSEFKTDIQLSSAQATFWNTIYTKGLSEFLYRNNIDVSTIAQFSADPTYTRKVSTVSVDVEKVLVGVGGGKDSIVSIELLEDYERTGFILETGKEYPVAREVCDIAEMPYIVTKRTLDSKLYSGVQGSYDGHMPISAVYAFLGILEAGIGQYAHVVVSNEYSSSFGTVTEEGKEVNHQWSKSIEFEEMFQAYVREQLTPDIRYFSLLRPFYELRIMRMFSEMGRKYFNTFTSCNRNFAHTHDGETRWCGVCPKCAFGFLMLATFLPQDEVVGIFKKNLFEDMSLVPLFKDLLGFGTMKPFDCVGTFEESRFALSEVYKRWGMLPVLQELIPLLSGVELSPEVLQVQQAKTVPSRFRMLGMESALILGYGKEGKSTEAYLHHTYPTIKIGTADKKNGKSYLEAQHAYDITIKTPGIPSALVQRQYTTATNLFFSAVSLSKVVGVTGSKGKSTTATLIYEMLKESGKKVCLIGNIGAPALESLLMGDAEMYVYELSSYQLEDLDVSPHIAVVTSLFPEHLDHHGTLAKYYQAKRNIVCFQNPSDIYVYPSGFPILDTWAEEIRSHKQKIETPPFEITNPSLRGAHMHSNIELAYTVARVLGVTDTQAEQVVGAFEGLPHRLMHVGTFCDIAFYDDSISTTPESTIAGIHAVGNVDTLILGGVDRGYDFAELERVVRSAGIRNVILFPESGNHMMKSEDGLRILHTQSMDEAIAFAYEHTEKGKSCLLSPSAPSYNLFANFEERGDMFIEAVKKHASQ